MISKNTIEKVFEISRVEEVIGEFIQLKKSGSNYKGLSPFTNEKTPSFMISPSKQIWKDFSSGKGGNIVAFLMEHEQLSYPQAIKFLAKKYNIEVEETAINLNRQNLDDLYDADINPISAFPGTGITVWGQKTLLQGSSALDRVNVRRLLIDVRRKVRNIANTLLFEPNRAETLEKFSSLVSPILQRIQNEGGVDRYKVVIDTTTTTQADVENNTIRGKIYLQPTRTVEFVALDFVVTNAGSALL